MGELLLSNSGGYPFCGHLIREPYLINNYGTAQVAQEERCKLPRDHAGDHDNYANWNGRLLTSVIGTTNPGVDVEIRHCHGYGVLKVRTKEDAVAVLQFFQNEFSDLLKQ